MKVYVTLTGSKKILTGRGSIIDEDVKMKSNVNTMQKTLSVLAATALFFPSLFSQALRPNNADLESRINRNPVVEAYNPRSEKVLPKQLTVTQDDIYDFSGYVEGFPDSTQSISDATLTFKAPDGKVYPSVKTDANGYYSTSIDTYVEIDDVDIAREAAVSKPVLNPTANRSGFYINVPYNTDVSVRAYNMLGEDLTNTVLKNRVKGNTARGVYFQEADFSEMPSELYFVNVRIGNTDKTLKFTHLRGASSYSGMHSAPMQGSGKWMRMNKAEQQNNGPWELTIEHPDYQPRTVLFNAEPGEINLDLDLIDKSWDLEFFDEITKRIYQAGTSRWDKCPKLLIIDGPVEGYNNFETPIQDEINTLIEVWKDYQKYTNGFIDIPDSNIYVTHDVNDEVFQDAVRQVYDGNVSADTSNNKRWDISLWTDRVSTGDHGEYVENGVIKGAVQRYAKGMPKRIYEQESSQSIGFPKDPSDPDKFHDGTDFTDLYKQCMRLNYSRPSWTLSPDTATKPLN